MRALWKRVSGGERQFLRNFSIFIGGKAIAAGITVLATPLIARFFLPEDFGTVAVFVSLTVILIPISSAAYDRAIVVSTNLEESTRLLVVTLFITTAFCLLVGLVQVTLHFSGLEQSQLASLGAHALLLPPVILIGGWTLGFTQWLILQKRYGDTAAAEVLQAAVRSSYRLGAGFVWGSSVSALVVSIMVATALKLLYTIRKCQAAGLVLSRQMFAFGKLTDYTALLMRYRDFPRYNLATTLLMTTTAQLPVLLLGIVFGPMVAGFYAMADRLINAPINLFSNSLRSVLLQQLSGAWNNGRSIKRQFNKTIVGMALLSIFPTAILFFAGEQIFAALLGQTWKTTGTFVQILAPLVAVTVMGAPFHAASQATRRQRSWFWLEIISAVGRVGLIPVALLDGIDPFTFVCAFAWVSVGTKLVAYVIVFSQINSIGRVVKGPHL